MSKQIEKRTFEFISEPRIYMSQDGYDWLERNIANLELEMGTLNKLINELRDEGTLRPDSASLDTANRLLQVSAEVSEKKSHLSNAIIVKTGDIIEGYIMGMIISVKFDGEDEPITFKIGTFYDATMNRDSASSQGIIYFNAPILKDMKSWIIGKQYTLENGIKMKILNLQEP